MAIVKEMTGRNRAAQLEIVKQMSRQESRRSAGPDHVIPAAGGAEPRQEAPGAREPGQEVRSPGRRCPEARAGGTGPGSPGRRHGAQAGGARQEGVPGDTRDPRQVEEPFTWKVNRDEHTPGIHAHMDKPPGRRAEPQMLGDLAYTRNETNAEA